MKVYALVGKSGTGKSYQAANLCRGRNIDGIIDDGLFIYGNDVAAGISAKVQPTKIGAVKTALFTKDEHKYDVREKIKEINPESLLIIGTSDEMVERIAKRLELPDISETIYIEDITTEKEREEAQKQRNELGKHVVPVPTFALKRNFSGYLVDPLKIFRTWGRKKEDFLEKSVVRPTYSYRGDYILSDKVIDDIIRKVAYDSPKIKELGRIDIKKTSYGIIVSIILYMKKGCNIVKAAEEFQHDINEKVEFMTAFNVEKVNIEIRGIV